MTIRTDTDAEGAAQAPSIRWALASLALSILLAQFSGSVAIVALPTLAKALGASFQQVQWIVIAYLLAITTLIVSVGRLGDLFGRRRLLLVGLGVFTVASIACGAATTLWLLIAARMAQGAGAAIMTALAMAVVGETVPREKTGSAMGLLGTTSAVGTALGPSAGGFLIAGFDWPVIFLVNVPFALLAFLLAYRALPRDRQSSGAKRERFDVIGTLLLAATLTAYALAMTTGRADFGLLNVALLLATAVGVGAFVLTEAKSASPLVRLELFSNPALSAGFATSAIVMTVIMAIFLVGPFYLSAVLGLDAGRVGLVMSVGPVVGALSGVPAGRAVDRFGPQRMAIAGLIGMATGCAILPVMATLFGVAGYAPSLVVITSGYALFQAANNTAVMTNVRSDERGVVSGLLNLSRNLGVITGASAMGAVFAVASAAPDITTASSEAVATGMRVTFAISAGLVVVALAVLAVSRLAARR